jgi:hypothetical protein
LPNISTINGVDITTLASFGGVAFADGQTLDGQTVSLVTPLWVTLSDQTATGSSSITFDGYMDSTYEVYCYTILGYNPASDGRELQFQVNAVGQTGYNESFTVPAARASNDEAAGGGSKGLQYQAGNTTGYITITTDVGSGSDESASGQLFVYNPGSNALWTHFQWRTSGYESSNYQYDTFGAAICRTATAIDDINFKPVSGNMDVRIILQGLPHS